MKTHENWCWNPSFQTRVTYYPCFPLALQGHTPNNSLTCGKLKWFVTIYQTPESVIFFYYTQTASFFIPVNKNIISCGPKK